MDREQAMNLGSARHDATRMVMAMASMTERDIDGEIQSPFTHTGYGADKKDLREELLKEVQFWTEVFKHHGSSDRWLDLEEHSLEELEELIKKCDH